MATGLQATEHQALDVPLLEYENPDVHEYAQRNMTIHQTSVNIPPEQPNDYIIWSLGSFVYGNPFCLGLAALIYSTKARDRKVVGDLDGAQHYASTAHILNIVATVLVSFGIVLCIVVPILVLHYSR